MDEIQNLLNGTHEKLCTLFLQHRKPPDGFYDYEDYAEHILSQAFQDLEKILSKQ